MMSDWEADIRFAERRSLSSRSATRRSNLQISNIRNGASGESPTRQLRLDRCTERYTAIMLLQAKYRGIESISDIAIVRGNIG